jgi:hypothetical protein
MDEISYGATISNNTLVGNGSQGGNNGGIFLSTSSNIEAFGNALKDNAAGFWIYEDSTRGAGAQGAYKATNINIHDNYTTLLAGQTIINGGAQSDATNQFINNHYCLSGSAGFSTGGGNMAQAAWQAAGYDTAGTFNCGF